MNLIRKLVSKNLLLNKKRTVVTIVGIILAVALLSALSSLVISFQKSIVVYQKQKSGDFHVGFTRVTEADLKDFDSNRSIERYFTTSEIGYANLDGSKNEYKPYCRVISLGKNGLKAAGLTIIDGRLPENASEIVIPRHLKTNGRVELKIGEKLTLDLGKRIDIQAGEELDASYGFMGADSEQITSETKKEYTIVGIVERPIFGIEPYECPAYTYITCSEELGNNISVFARLNGQGLRDSDAVTAGILGVDVDLYKRVNGMDTRYYDEAGIMELDRQIQASKYGYYVNQWLIQYERVWPIDNMFLGIFLISIIVALIIIFTSVYCIKNSFDISVTEKIRQYGMLSSVGATKKQLRKSVHTEAAIMGAIGIPAGIVGGMFAAYVLIQISNVLLRESLNLTLVFYPSIGAAVVAALLGIVTIYFSAAGSARKASRISPMEAIRNQNEIILNSKSIKAPKYIHKIWGIGGVVSYKNIKRNKKKYRTTVVSIVICTVTFIVISYFMSMAMDLVDFSYVNDRYNVSLSISYSKGHDIDKNEIKDIANTDNYAIVQTVYMMPKDMNYSDDFKAYCKNIDMSVNEQRLIIATVDDEYFDSYAKECGLGNSAGKVIFVNNYHAEWIEDGKSKSGDIETYDINKGEDAKFYYMDASNEDNIKLVDYEIPIDYVTSERPLGYRSYDTSNFLVMSDSTAKKYNIPNDNDYNIYFISSDADKLQDELDTFVSECGDDEAGYSIYNRDKNEREEKSLFTLIDIFAYGLIVVIALIGITNIINTLNTSMELRSREFSTLRSVGMTDKQFKKMVRLESIFTSAKSLIIGVIVGMLISFAINRIECTYDTVIPFHPPIIAALIAVAVVMILIYAIISSSMSRINKRNIIETIKNENL